MADLNIGVSIKHFLQFVLNHSYYSISFFPYQKNKLKFYNNDVYVELIRRIRDDNDVQVSNVC